MWLWLIAEQVRILEPVTRCHMTIVGPRRQQCARSDASPAEAAGQCDIEPESVT